jgi:hypothetical protein
MRNSNYEESDNSGKEDKEKYGNNDVGENCGNNNNNNNGDVYYNYEEGFRVNRKQENANDCGDNDKFFGRAEKPEVWRFNPPGPRITPVWEYVAIPRETTTRETEARGIAV